ncbi:uncharacterized protein [Aegilops tauschii subsp. strangulata]|uniref:uncharacterized protein n=1 Tax=Aegilops tauschii subsp. strangulata TaxID=200361 RepID=UPI003CC8BA1D
MEKKNNKGQKKENTKQNSDRILADDVETRTDRRPEGPPNINSLVEYPRLGDKHSQALPRTGSDHTPILWDSVVGGNPRGSSYKFEKWWMLRAEFKELASKNWSAPTLSCSPIEVWQEKVWRFRKFSKGWSRNVDSEIRKLKIKLTEEYNDLDIKSETVPLSDLEKLRMKNLLSELHNLWIVEEVKARQRAKDRDILEGDRNTKYFQTVANQRRRKTLINALEGRNGTTNDIKEMLEIATNYYKGLFRGESRGGFRISNDFFTPEEKVNDLDNQSLQKPFSEEEVKDAIFGSYSDGAPGPDGLSFLFLQNFWEIIKHDIMVMFDDFHKGNLDIYRLNFAMLTLIPKEKDATNMEESVGIVEEMVDPAQRGNGASLGQDITPDFLDLGITVPNSGGAIPLGTSSAGEVDQSLLKVKLDDYNMPGEKNPYSSPPRSPPGGIKHCLLSPVTPLDLLGSPTQPWKKLRGVAAELGIDKTGGHGGDMSSIMLAS